MEKLSANTCRRWRNGEQELGEERQLNQYEGSENEWEQQPLPDGPITAGIDEAPDVWSCRN
jgi:hypothetical protein